MSKRDADMVAAISAVEDDDTDEVLATIPAARRPAQVYSVRIPVDRIDQLRSVAANEHTTPSALIRAWVVERLDSAPRRSNVVSIRPSRDASASQDSRPDLEIARSAALNAI